MENDKSLKAEENTTILCAASSYEEKYYFNPLFDKLPKDIKKELQIMSVIFTEECGGILTLKFNEDKELIIETSASDNDFLYDEISAGLLSNELIKEKAELFEELEAFYKYFVLRDFSDIEGLEEMEILMNKLSAKEENK